MLKETIMLLSLAIALPASSCEPDTSPADQKAPETTTIKVTLSGEINTPQTLDVPKGSNLKEVINLAGGATPGGAISRAVVVQNKRWESHNLRKESGPILVDNAIVIIPFKVVMDEPPPESSLFAYGTNPVPLDKLKLKLQSQIKGEWIISSRRGMTTLEVRMGAGSKYRMYSIYLFPPDKQTQNPDQDQRTLYSITAFPIGHGYGDDTLAKIVRQHLQELCRK